METSGGAEERRRRPLLSSIFVRVFFVKFSSFSSDGALRPRHMCVCVRSALPHGAATLVPVDILHTHCLFVLILGPRDILIYIYIRASSAVTSYETETLQFIADAVRRKDSRTGIEAMLQQRLCPKS